MWFIYFKEMATKDSKKKLQEQKEMLKDVKTPEPFKKIGRPSKYDPIYCEEVVEFMAKGFSFEAFAGHIEVNIDTLNEWASKHEEFSAAKQKAFSKNRIFWEQLGIENIINKSDSESFGEGFSKSSSRSLNAAVWVFNMKNRFKWRDKQPDENEVIINNSNSQIALSNLSDEELDRKIKEKLARNQSDES